MCLGEELTPEIREEIKAAPSKIDAHAGLGLSTCYGCPDLILVVLHLLHRSALLSASKIWRSRNLADSAGDIPMVVN